MGLAAPGPQGIARPGFPSSHPNEAGSTPTRSPENRRRLHDPRGLRRPSCSPCDGRSAPPLHQPQTVPPLERQIRLPDQQ
eukprot:scaffold30042_cov29-Prasinocladus_malaysianus.AAC.1